MFWRSARSFHLALGAALLAILLSGCKSGKKAEPVASEPPPPQENWAQAPLATPAQPVVPVAQGAPPLVYLVETNAMVRVVDTTSNQDLLRMPVAARTLVAVDSSVGIRVGSATMKLGPLPADHQYAIFLESNATSTVRRGTIRPGSASTQPGRTP